MFGLRFLGVVAILGAAPAGAAALTDIALAPAGEKVALTLSFDGDFGAPSWFLMDAPRRIVIDLPGNKTNSRTLPGSTGISAVRAAQFSEDKARLVIDLADAATISGSVVDGNRLVFTLAKADDAAFRTALRKGRVRLPGAEVAAVRPAAPKVEAKAEPAKASPAPAPVQVVATPPLPAPKPAPVSFAEARPEQVRQEQARPEQERAQRVRSGFRPIVMIDAGHGGHDVGAISVYEGKREKDVTLAIARAVGRELEATGRYRVQYTRADDRFIPLPERVRIARAARANLFISIHADSAPASEARGATVYTLSEVASDKEAARLAAKENKAGMLGGFRLAADSADVADILIDLAQRETMNVSAEFATVLQREMSPDVHFKSNAHRFAGFIVLKAADVPSVLLETGYLSNAEDSRFLFSESGQRAIAKGVRDAVEAHFNRRIASR